MMDCQNLALGSLLAAILFVHSEYHELFCIFPSVDMLAIVYGWTIGVHKLQEKILFYHPKHIIIALFVQD
jgi:hypothetical protein